MKKVLALILASALVLGAFVGCAKKGEDEPMVTIDPNEPLAGGFSVSNVVAGKLPEGAKEAFDEGNEGLDGVSVKALACVGTQVVAGMNYAILENVKAVAPDAKDNLKIGIYYKAPGQAAVKNKSIDFNFKDYIGEDNPSVLSGEKTGSWKVPEGGGLSAMPQDMATFTAKALGEYDKLELNLLACVGTQVVAGRNYAFVATGTDNENKTGLFMVVIYVDLKDNASVLKVCPINVSEIVKG